MKWIEAKVIFDFYDKELAADLISDIFSDFDMQGVVIESTETDPTQDWDEEIPKAADNDAVIGYFPQNEYARERCRTLEKKLACLSAANTMACQVVYSEVDEENWAESWKEYFWPEKVGKNIVVKPTWREYQPSEGEIVLEIDPGMAFGTGTHPTTYLCIRMLEKYLNPGDVFLDVGTGSGILMVAAEKLRAGKLVGTDNDELATEIARKNLLLNSVDKEKFSVITGNLTECVEGRFDIVISNILSRIILVLLEDIRRVLRKNGIFICSGIIEASREAVLRKMETMNFVISEVQTEDQWVVIVGKYQG